MANAIRFWVAATEQDYITQLRIFLENVVGWYRVHVFSDTSSDRDYVFKSEGDDPNRPPVVIRVQGNGNVIRFRTYETWDEETSTGTGLLETIPAIGIPEITHDQNNQVGYAVANKDRVITVTIRPFGSIPLPQRGYVGRMESFYDAQDDLYPNVILGMNGTIDPWTSTVLLGALTVNGSTNKHVMYNLPNAITDGSPNNRSGEFTFTRPVIYNTVGGGLNEVRGRLIGAYRCSTLKFGHNSFARIDNQPHIIHIIYDTTPTPLETFALGPISDDEDFPDLNYSALSVETAVDYTKRGLELETPSLSGTLALWRFDELSGNILPEETGNFDLTRVATPSVSVSPLQQAITLNGSTQYTTAPGNATVSGVLLEDWTCEAVFLPDNIGPTTSGTLVEFGGSGQEEKSNVLASLSYSANGGIRIFWEKNSGERVDSTTTSGIVQKSRWNYIAAVKKANGPNYDLEVWHCSFGDFRIPKLVTTFSGVDNATGGQDSSSFWFLGTDVTLTNMHDGRLDDTRVTDRALTQEEIEDSCLRVIL